MRRAPALPPLPRPVARRRGQIAACVLAGTGLAAAGAQAAESYEAVVSSALVVDGDDLLQTFQASCIAVDANDDAALRISGKELRFVAARDEVAVVSVDDGRYDLLTGAVGSYRYDADAVAGAHVFARFSARCGTDAVFDDASVDTAPVVTAPLLAPPFAVRRTDTFEAVALDAIPAGVDVEFVDVTVTARPRGDERVIVSVVGGATELARAELGGADFDASGHATLSPHFTAPIGALALTATFVGVAAVPVVGVVVPNDVVGEGEGEGDDGDDDGDDARGCTQGGAAVPAVVLFAGLAHLRRGLRRRR